MNESCPLRSSSRNSLTTKHLLHTNFLCSIGACFPDSCDLLSWSLAVRMLESIVSLPSSSSSGRVIGREVCQGVSCLGVISFLKEEAPCFGGCPALVPARSSSTFFHGLRSNAFTAAHSAVCDTQLCGSAWHTTLTLWAGWSGTGFTKTPTVQFAHNTSNITRH